MTTPINCPSCGAAVPFQSRTSVSATCPYCRSVLVRHDMKIEEIGKVGTVMDDMTPFQIGTQGRYQGKSFTILGRARWKWEGGYWNEWHMSFGGDEAYWLGEAQGQCAVSRPVAPPKKLPAMTPGAALTVAGATYEVRDVKSAVCEATEGEMPVIVKPGTVKTAADCGNDAGGYACIEVEPGKQPSIYVGSIEDYDSLSLSNLRAIDGW